MEVDKGERVIGVFTDALVRHLQKVDLYRITCDQIAHPVRNLVQEYTYFQTPAFIGPEGWRLLAEVDDYIAAFDFNQRQNYNALTLEDVQARYAVCCDQLQVPLASMHSSFGRAFLEKGAYAEAVDALETAIAQRGSADPDLWTLALACAQVGARCYTEALSNLHSWATTMPSPTEPLQHALSAVKALARGKTALLVGIDDYASPDIPPLKGAVNDVTTLKAVLIDKYGFCAEDVIVLLNRDATQERILLEFKRLVARSHYQPALFYFAGYGSTDDDDRPTIVSADGRQPEVYDITLNELADLASGKSINLTTIVDAGWTRTSGKAQHSRILEGDARSKVEKRDLSLGRESEKYRIHIGRVSLYHHSIERTYTSGDVEHEFASPSPENTTQQVFHGKMTYALIQSLQEAVPSILTYSELIHLMVAQKTTGRSFEAFGDSLAESVFDPTPNHEPVFACLAQLEGEPIRQMILLLERFIEQRNDHYPEGYLNLGIAYAYLHEYDKAIDSLEKALAQQKIYPEAHYHLGRVLVESRRDAAGAVSELRQAIQEDDKNIPARYYLGRALQALVEQEILVETEKAYREYLASGAPLGQVEQVQAFLDARKDGGGATR